MLIKGTKKLLELQTTKNIHSYLLIETHLVNCYLSLAMNLFSLPFITSLKPKWKFSGRSVLWSLRCSDEGFILGEDRNTETKSGTFFCLHLSSGKPLWQEKIFGEPWWIGIEALVGSRAYLHGFKKPDMPEHQKILCIDLPSGNEVWRNEQLSFYYADNDRLFAFKELFERRVYYRLDLQSGEILEEHQQAPELPEPDMSAYRFPKLFTAHQSEFEFLQRFFPPALNLEQTEALLYKNYFIGNSYTPNNNRSLTNTLYIIDSEKKKLRYTDILNNETSYPVPDSFFIFKEHLFYIKERTTLVALQL
ncbi:MAG: DUF4905 domain-containing protein [Bacteroidetes bacterium]|nr:DUF4905 domain-containing protein [Bacteroidota bacterium]